MARTHRWYFLVNQAGEPIENANIYITKAGTDDPVWIYYDEFGSSGTRNAPQVSSLNNGYFEFWIDENEDFDVCNTEEVDDENATSYPFNQKFKIRWEKTGIAQGFVDYVDVFPPNRYFEKVDLTNCSSEAMNKLISNRMACEWTDHAEWHVLDDGLPIHGLEMVRVTEQDHLENKIISNYYGWLWTRHEESTVESGLSGDAYGTGYFPHGLRPYQEGSYDTTWEVIVNDALITNILTDIEAVKYGVFDILIPDWSLNSAQQYEAVIEHNFLVEYPHVTIYDVTEVGQHFMVKTADVQYLDNNSIKVVVDHEPRTFKVRISV